jgi:hypothetical protein
MKTIDQLIAAKREQIAKLQAQVDVLEELAAEPGVRGRGRGRGRRGPGRAAAARSSGRAGRGANQRKILAVLTSAPQRSRDIAAAAKLSPAATAQVLIGLKKAGTVTQAGRGLYKLTGSLSAPVARRRGGRKRRRGAKGAKKKNVRRPISSASSSKEAASSTEARADS